MPASGKTRLLWEITIGKRGLTGLCPLEQKRGARGWNTPETADTLAARGHERTAGPRCQGDAGAATERHHAGRFNLDLAAASAPWSDIRSFSVGHPDTFIDLVEAAPKWRS